MNGNPMERTLKLGRLAGFPVEMSWSVLVIVWLVTWGTSSGVLPQTAPGYAVGEYWAAGLVAAVLFFASLACHEVAHAVVARRSGMEVLGLTLWLFGGIATLRGEPRSPRDDLRIAAVGPLVSLGLSLGFAALTVLLMPIGVPIVLAVTAWLALVNLMLGVFNLLPGAPLDGGRVLRAWLWKRHGDRAAATLSATKAGQRTGAVLIGVGLFEVLLGEVLGGVWMSFIGWFILNAATQEESAARMMAALEGLSVGEVMTATPAVVADDLTLRELVEERLPWRAHAAYPTVDPEGRPSGLLLLDRLSAVPLARGGTTLVRDIATPLADVVTAAPDELLTEAVGRLSAQSDGRLLVVDHGELAGIVTPGDLTRVLRLRGLPVPGPRPPSDPA